MMKKNMTLAGLIIVLCLMIFLGGCAGVTSRLEVDFGTSCKLQKFNQILDPEAEKNLKPVEGLDVKAAELTLEKYRKEFEKPPEPARVLMEMRMK